MTADYWTKLIMISLLISTLPLPLEYHSALKVVIILPSMGAQKAESTRL